MIVGPGRPSKGAEALKHQVCFRLNDADHITYLKLGGVRWFREQLKACGIRVDAMPTAHQPFPHAFSVTNAKTGEPVPHAVTVIES